MTKEELRKISISARSGLGAQFRRQASGQICQRLFSLSSWRNRKTIMCFLTIKDEVETAAIVERGWREGKTVIVPKVEGKKLLCCKLTAWSQLAAGTFGVPEPQEAIVVDPLQLQLVLVPALAFDPAGRRLGYGAGFFDRLLKKTDALRIGLAYAAQIQERLPEEENDCRVEEIITENEIIICSEG
jgi:5-formyltetrahydrofolate cyclo-ligase